MAIRVYWASVTGNRKISGDQSRLKNLLESYKIESTWIDITTSSSVMKRMRQECSNPKALPPQIFNEDIYLGNVDDLNDSIEADCVKQWLKLEGANDVIDSMQKIGEIITTTESQSNTESVPETNDTNSIDLVQNNTVGAKIKTSKSVTSAINNFENLKISPKVSRKTITLQSENNNDDNKQEEDSKTSRMDEERRRRILGLPPLEENGSIHSKYLQDKTNDLTPETNGLKDVGGSKIGSIYDMADPAS